jgi:serine/threonine protein kinase
MAEIVDIAGDGPVNDGEQRVLDALVEQLGPEVRIIPNWTVVHPGNLDECDAIVVTNDAVFIVETKDLAGDVEVEQNEFIYNEKLRPHPYHQTHKKAQRLRSKLNGLLPVFGSNGWVEPQVVFARQPNSLYVDPLMADRFIAIGQVGSMLGSNSPRIHPNQHGRLSGLIDQVVEAITSGGRLRDREKFVVDGYRVDEVLFEHEATGFARLAATSKLTGLGVVLELDPLPPAMGPQEQATWRSKTVSPYRMAALIGPHTNLLAATAAYYLDDGTIVLVWPSLTESALKVLLENDFKFVAAETNSMVRDIASALAQVHAAGFTHGSIDPTHCAMTPAGRGMLRFGLNVHKAVEGQAGDLAAFGMMIGVLAQRTGNADLSEVAAQLVDPAGPALSAADVVEALQAGVVVVEQGNQVLANLFTDLEPLTAVGGVTVYSAKDQGGAAVAVKVLSGADSDDPETWSEYRVLSDLDHPHIVRTMGVGRAAEGPYLVTEFLGGVSLRDVVDGAVEIPDSQKITVAVQLLSALDAMHPATSAIAALVETGSPEAEAEADRLRNAGVVHNDIEPANVRVLPIRGAVLFDFDLAGRPGAEVVGLAAAYRPADLPMDAAAADGDIYAVGAMLHELLTGLMPYEIDLDDRRIVQIDEKLPIALQAVLAKACASDQGSRFATAADFSRALLGAGIEDGIVIELPLDQADLTFEIERLARAGDFDGALAICPVDWLSIRTRIEHKKAMVEDQSPPLVDVDGVFLRFTGTAHFSGVSSASTNSIDQADALTYSVTFPDGGVLEFAFMWGYFEGILDAWVSVTSAVHVHSRLERLAHGLRPGTKVAQRDPELLSMLLRIAKISPERGPNWSNVVKTNSAELNSLAGFDVCQALKDAGAIAVGTQAEVLGEIGPRRGELCVQFAPFAEGMHVPAVAYFATRVMALFRTIDPTAN